MTRLFRHNMFRTVLLAAAAVLIGFASGSAQLVERWRIGGFVNWGLLDYTANLRALPGVPSCCPQYTDGGGNTLGFGASWQLPLFSQFAWEGRLSFVNYNGTLEAEEYELVTAGRDTTTATFGHSIQVKQPGLGFDGLFSFAPVLGLRLIGGVRGEWMMGGTFHQEEVILSPDNIRFENEQRRRLVYDGDLSDETPLHFSVVGGIRYELPLNTGRTMLLSPEILFWQDFSDIVEDRDWRNRGVRFGLLFQFLHESKPEEPSPLDPTPIPQDVWEQEMRKKERSGSE